MPLSPTTKVYAVQDCKIAKLTADSATAPTYSPLVDVPGIKKVGLSFDFKSVELRGDNKRLDADSVMLGGKITFDHAKLSFDAVPVILGGTTAYSGTAPAQIASYTRASVDVMPYFKLEAVTPASGGDTVGSDVHLLIPKCKVTKYDLGLAEEDYQIFSGEASAVFTISSDQLFALIMNETAVAIA